jgi:hypothetical protein
MRLPFSTPHRFASSRHSFHHFNGDNRVYSIKKQKNTFKYGIIQRIYCLYSY